MPQSTEALVRSRALVVLPKRDSSNIIVARSRNDCERGRPHSGREMLE